MGAQRGDVTEMADPHEDREVRTNWPYENFAFSLTYRRAFLNRQARLGESGIEFWLPN